MEDLSQLNPTELNARSCKIVSVVDNTLHFLFSNFEMRIRLWPDPFAEIRPQDGTRWSNGDASASQLFDQNSYLKSEPQPEQMFFMFDLHTCDRDPAWSFQETIRVLSAEIPDQVKDYAFYTKWSRWETVRLAGSHTEIAELMESNPIALTFWLEEFITYENEITTPDIAQLRLPQRKLIEACGLPPEKKWVKITRKITVDQLNEIQLDDLRMLVGYQNSSFFHYLQHRERITGYEIQCVIAACLAESAKDESGGAQLRRAIRTALDTIKTIRCPIDLTLPKFLNEAVNRAENRFASDRSIFEFIYEIDWKTILPFECPKDWEHLDTLEKIKAEGRSQGHCLTAPWSYLKKEWFLFRVNSPVRATICVEVANNRTRKITEYSGYRNAEIVQGDLETIKSALKDARSIPSSILEAK